MKKKIFLAITALTIFMFQACKMDGLDKDPNRATVVTPDLVLNFKAKEFDGTNWSDLNTTVKTHLFISLYN